jgi:hypothetical protein
MQDIIAKTKHFSAHGVGTPYIGERNTDRVLAYMNVSGAYGGESGVETARSDAGILAAAPRMLAALRKVETFLAGFGAGDLLAEVQAAIAAIKQ